MASQLWFLKNLLFFILSDRCTQACVESCISKWGSGEHSEVKQEKASGLHFLKAEIHVSGIGRIQRNCLPSCWTWVYYISPVLQQLSITVSGQCFLIFFTFSASYIKLQNFIHKAKLSFCKIFSNVLIFIWHLEISKVIKNHFYLIFALVFILSPSVCIQASKGRFI